MFARASPSVVARRSLVVKYKKIFHIASALGWMKRLRAPNMRTEAAASGIMSECAPANAS